MWWWWDSTLLTLLFLWEQGTEAVILHQGGLGSGKCRKICRLGDRTLQVMKTLGCSHRNTKGYILREGFLVGETRGVFSNHWMSVFQMDPFQSQKRWYGWWDCQIWWWVQPGFWMTDVSDVVCHTWRRGASVLFPSYNYIHWRKWEGCLYAWVAI